MSTSSWLVGSICGFADQTVQINGATAVPMTFSYDGTYLDHATAALSMTKALTVALLAAGLTGAYCYIGQDGYVHIEASGSFTLEWTSSGTALRDALGFKTNLGGGGGSSSSYSAPLRSTLLWVPRRNESPSLAPLGIVGDSTHAVTQVVASDGTQVTREFGSPVRRNEYRWTYIDRDQYWTSSEAGGELFAWIRDVVVPGAKFFLYRQVGADYTDTSAVTLGTGLGPYESTNGLRSLALIRSSGFERTDCRYDWTVKVLNTAEYAS